MSRFINTEQIFFLDNGEPNALGTVYFGEPNQDAKTNPKVPYLDEALTTPATATQSLSAGGKLSSTLWLDGDYSMIVDDSFGAQVDEDLSIISGQADAAGISLTVNSLSRTSVQSYLENAQIPDYATLRANLAAAVYAIGDQDISVLDPVGPAGYIVDNTGGAYTDNGIDVITGGNQAWLRAYSGYVDVRWAGASGGASEDIGSELKAIADAGITHCFVVNSTWSASGSHDLLGLTIAGSGRMTTGTCTNFKLSGISNRKDVSVFEQKQPCKQLSGASTNKLLFKRSDTAFSLFTRNATDNEYIYTEIEQSSDSSPAVSVGAPFELMRAQQRWRCHNVITWRKDYDRATGDVTTLGQNLDTYFVQSGLTRLDATGSNLNPVDAWSLGDGASIEFDFASTRFNTDVVEMDVTIYTTSGSSENVEILVNGSVVETFDARADGLGSSLRVVRFSVDVRSTGSTVTVEIRNASTVSTRRVYPLGLNFRELKNEDSGAYQQDYFVAWYQTAGAYVDTNGAGDYAIQDAGSSLFCGSYHGGETSTYLRMIVGSDKTDPTSLAANYFGIAKSVGVAQRTTITGGAGGGSYSTVSNLNYVIDGVESLRVCIDGTANIETIYTNLHPAADEFTRVLYPSDVSLPVSETTQALGQNIGDVVQLDDNSALYTRHTFTLYNSSRNSFGGPHIWNRVGTYRKLYYGPVVSDLASMSEFDFEYNREFGKGKY